MGKTKFYTLAAVGGLVVTTLVVSSMASAGTNYKGLRSGRSELSADFQEHRQEMRDMMANLDYETWSSTMADHIADMRSRADQMESQITEENFNILQQANQLRLDGKRDEARQLLEDSGLDFGFGGGPMMGGRNPHMTPLFQQEKVQ